jgi:subtilisin family serine protease
MRRIRRALCIGALLFPAVSATTAASAPPPSPWHLDRINQPQLPLDSNVAMGALTGAGIDIYIVDSGVLASHEQFGGRVLPGIDIPSSLGDSVVNPETTDCDGHGTHVSALSAGSTVGVATGARIIAVRVLDCDGGGNVADVVTALKWIRGHHKSGVVAVVNLSLGVDVGDNGAAIDAQVSALIDEGVVVTVAAGNGDENSRPLNACDISPGDVPRALTIGATTFTDSMATYSNFGPCIDLLAPGGTNLRPVQSAWMTSPTSYDNDVGTSMASPLVAGYAALLAQQQPGLCVDQIANAIVARATTGVITGVNPTTPNKMLFINTAPIEVGVPGQPSHVVTSVDDGSVVVSWDAPCDGGSAITSTTVSLLRSGKVVARKIVEPGTTAVRFSRVKNNYKYQVVVKARNAVGEGVATHRVTTGLVRSLRVGLNAPLTAVATFGGDLKLSWNVSASSRSVCKVVGTNVRFLRSGTCKVGLRTYEGATPVLRSLRVSR